MFPNWHVHRVGLARVNGFWTRLLLRVSFPAWLSLFWRAMTRRPLPVPSRQYLASCTTAEWPEYQAWIDHNERKTLEAWQVWRRQALELRRPAPISVVTPVCDTDPAQLRHCVQSVQLQAYPFWELLLVDDCSERPETQRLLEALATEDARIRCFRNATRLGISESTNRGLRAARGRYAAFLDHDDCLAPDALLLVANALSQDPDTDLLYTDRDSLSPSGRRLMHLMKPAWSPETLLSGNYLFHLCVYRLALVRRLGGLRARFDGSQDYDLALRAADCGARVRHLPAVLYHWRQHEASLAMAHHGKEHVFEAGMAALRESLKRRGLEGDISEIKSLWRGNYRVRLPPPDERSVYVASLPRDALDRGYCNCVREALNRGSHDVLVVLGPGLLGLNADAIGELTSWLQLDGVGLVTGKISTSDGRLGHGGMTLRRDGTPLSLFEGFPSDEPGYMAVTSIVHNVSIVHPFCFAVRRELWTALGGLDEDFMSGYGALDLALRAGRHGWRCVFDPFAQFIAGSEWAWASLFPEQDRQAFEDRWRQWLQLGDPCYHPALSQQHNDMRLGGAMPHGHGLSLR